MLNTKTMQKTVIELLVILHSNYCIRIYSDE